MPKLQPWLALGARDEKLRAAHGLIPKEDGWYKTFDGRTHYICKPCPLADAVAKLPLRIEAIRARRSGRSTPTVAVAGTLSLEGLADAYEAWLWQRLTTGVPRKLARRTYDDAIAVVGEFVECAGPHKAADAIGPVEFSDYAVAHLSNIAASSVRRKVIYIEAFANWAAPGSRKAGLLTRPWQYGADFRKPADADIVTSAADSDKAYTPDQLRKAFLAVRKNKLFRAAGWLALAGAFQPKDLALLPESCIDLDAGYIRFARGKTGVGRLCWLPPCARIAIRHYLADRADSANDDAAKLLFRSERGLPMYRDAEGRESGSRYDAMGSGWNKLTGLPMSGLRSTFATLADDNADQRAVDIVMGHKSGHVRSVRNTHYAKRFSPQRVERLVSAVISLAFGRKIRGSPPQPDAAPDAWPAPAVPAAKPQRQPGQSDTAASRRRVPAHQKRPVRQPG